MADDLGLLVLALISALFLVVAHYATNYLRNEIPRGGRAFESCLLAFLSAASLVALSQHLALLWIGMESTTLAIAPLIYSRDDGRSLEAVC
jgi:hydrogenase-4 component F